MNQIAFPRRTLLSLDAVRTVIAVEPHMTKIPAYAMKLDMTLDEMRQWAKKNGGIIMQQDDSMLPPFVLTKYDADGNVVSVS